MTKQERIDWLQSRIEECERDIAHSKGNFDACDTQELLNHYRRWLNELVPIPHLAPFPISAGLNEEEPKEHLLTSWRKLKSAIDVTYQMMDEQDFIKLNFEDWLMEQDISIEIAVAKYPYLRSRAIDYIHIKKNEYIIAQASDYSMNGGK